MPKDIWDNYECEGQMSLDDFWSELPEQMIAVSKLFARARKQMSLSEYKAFVFALCHIKWTEKSPNIIYQDKKTLAAIVGINSDSDHLSQDLIRSIGKLPEHSIIKFQDTDKDFYDSGAVINRITMLKNRVRIKFDDEYIKLFSELTKDYITMWSSDIFHMKSERTIAFYEDLRLNSDTRTTNHKGFGVKALKEMFDIPKNGKGSYMRSNGHLDRKAFEKYVVEALCEDMKHCKMIQLVIQEDGKLYRKVKRGSRVLGYEFEWNITEHPAIGTANEIAEVKQAVEKDPEILKIAKDIVKGRKKAKKAKNTAMLTNDYSDEDIRFLELDLSLNRTAKEEEEYQRLKESIEKRKEKS